MFRGRTVLAGESMKRSLRACPSCVLCSVHAQLTALELPEDLLLAEVATFFPLLGLTPPQTPLDLLLLHEYPECKARILVEIESLGLKVRDFTRLTGFSNHAPAHETRLTDRSSSTFRLGLNVD
jgi:hypothetical protein